MIKKYIKKPVIIEAVQLNFDTVIEILNWINKSPEIDGFKPNAEYEPRCQCQECKHMDEELIRLNGKGLPPFQLGIKTLEGWITASLDDYVIKGTKGEFYPCKPNIFEEIYDKANN